MLTTGPSSEPNAGVLETIEAVDRHVNRFIGPVETVLHEKVSDRLHIDVHLARANSTSAPYFALVTSGMSDLPMPVGPGFESWRFCELMICLPEAWPISSEAFEDRRNYWPVWLLKAMARYPHDNQTWLGAGHTVVLSDDLARVYPQFTAVLILRSQLLPVEALEFGNESKRIRLWSLYPLYREELELKLGAGSDVLEERFKQNDITEVFNPGRGNVAVHLRKH